MTSDKEQEIVRWSRMFRAASEAAEFAWDVHEWRSLLDQVDAEIAPTFYDSYDTFKEYMRQERVRKMAIGRTSTLVSEIKQSL